MVANGADDAAADALSVAAPVDVVFTAVDVTQPRLLRSEEKSLRMVSALCVYVGSTLNQSSKPAVTNTILDRASTQHWFTGVADTL